MQVTAAIACRLAWAVISRLDDTQVLQALCTYLHMLIAIRRWAFLRWLHSIAGRQGSGQSSSTIRLQYLQGC